MAFTRPSLAEIVDRVEQDLVSYLSVLRRAMAYVLARVIAGASHMLHGYIDYQVRQMLPSTADRTQLLVWGGLYSITLTAPDYAEATATATGDNLVEIPEDTILIDADGNEYTTVGDVTIAAGTATLALIASTAGADYTLAADDVLSFESPISGVDSSVTVVASTVDGTDEEDIEDYRVRVLARLADPAHGGNDADFTEWAKTVAGVTRVWVRAQALGEGTVLAYFVRDNDASGIIPSAGEISDVQDVFDEEAPSHCTSTAAAPTALTLDFEIDDHGEDEARADVEAELADLVFRTAEPGVTVPIEYLRAAIANADSGNAYTLNTPTVSPAPGDGELLIFGSVTWVST